MTTWKQTSDKLHAAICHAVSIMNMSIDIARSADGREAKDILRLALMAYEEPKSPWISVDQEVPKNARRVLACNAAGYVGAAQYANGHWNGIGKATHWQELPEGVTPPLERKA